MQKWSEITMRISCAHLQLWHFNIFFVISVDCLWQEGAWDSTWDNWWHYKEGPSHWGRASMMFSDDIWPACAKGHLQSPINIRLSDLIFDHTLKPLIIDGVSSRLAFGIVNAGQDVYFQPEPNESSVYFRDGPLSYRYRLYGGVIKFGSTSKVGSEHQIDGKTFPGEIQLYAYNSDLYHNFTLAVSRPNGLAAVSLFLQIGQSPTPDISALLSTMAEVRLKGHRRTLYGLILQTLLPNTHEFITYQGSLGFPACHETVTWILLNAPVTVTEEQMKGLRDLRMSEFKNAGSMADNYRPIQKSNNRFIRTNIYFNASEYRQCVVPPRLSYECYMET
ncbi:Carbonic anhydrase-related protein 10 [Echinococcus granulosus]|nr:Carbonic anhydrase-related protein 10 [Echinococcus granulosus]